MCNRERSKVTSAQYCGKKTCDTISIFSPRFYHVEHTSKSYRSSQWYGYKVGQCDQCSSNAVPSRRQDRSCSTFFVSSNGNVSQFTAHDSHLNQKAFTQVGLALTLIKNASPNYALTSSISINHYLAAVARDKKIDKSAYLCGKRLLPNVIGHKPM